VPSVSPATGLQIAAGGVLYTVGVTFYLWRRLPFHSAIWHAFVLAGAACHYLAIADGVVLA
jgi:hemolysin III